MDEAMDAAMEKDVPSGPPQKKHGYVPVFDHVTGKELPVLLVQSGYGILGNTGFIYAGLDI